MGFYELVACQKTSVSDSLVSGTNEQWPWLIALFSAGCDKLTNWSERTSQLKLTCCWFLRRDTHRCYFSFSKFLPPSSPLYEELDLPRTAENEAVPCRLCCGFCSVWRADRRQPGNFGHCILANFHFHLLRFFFVALTPLKNKSSWLVWFCHLLVTGWAGGAPSHLKLMEINESDGFFGAVGTISFSLCVYWCSLLTELQGFSGQCRWHRIFVGLPSRFSPGDLGNIFWLGMLSVKASCIAKPIVTKLTI